VKSSRNNFQGTFDIDSRQHQFNSQDSRSKTTHTHSHHPPRAKLRPQATLSTSMSSSMTQRSLTTRVVDTRRAPRTTARTTLVVKVRALPPPSPAIESIRARAAPPRRCHAVRTPHSTAVEGGVARGGSWRVCARSRRTLANNHFRGDPGAPAQWRAAGCT